MAVLLFSFVFMIPAFADDDLDNSEEQMKNSNMIQIVGIILIVVVVVIILIKNRNVLTRKPNGGANTALNEDKVADEIRLVDASFERDKFKNYASRAITEILGGMVAKNSAAIRLYESDYLFSAHEKQVREYIEDRKTNHYDDLKITSVELAEFKMGSSAEPDRLTTRISVSVLDYTTADSSGNVLDGSRLAKTSRTYRAEFIRVAGEQVDPEISNDCPKCKQPLKITLTGKCSECKTTLCDGSQWWVADSLTKWGR